ncbi:MAG: glycosyltransferase family 4 protein [Bernardetiaceae bacterium]|nr:glycosyltransferase family 4 protein [Bernardetiaceae bacterium]
MKIALLSPNYPPERGACASRMQRLAVGLAQAGHSVRVFTFLPNYPTGRIFTGFRGRWLHRAWQQGIRVWWLPLYPAQGPGRWARALSALSMAASSLLAAGPLGRFKPQVLLVQSPPLPLALSGWLLAKLTGAKLVLNVSDLWPSALADLAALSRRSLGYRGLAWAETWVSRRAHLLVGQSAEIGAYLARLAPQVPQLLYRNGVPMGLYPPPLAAAPPQPGPLRLVYAGVLGLAQGLYQLCQHVDWPALGAELHLYGEGPEREAIARWMGQNPARGVFLHPSVPPEQVPGLLRGFQAALVAQKAAVFGTVPSKLYEAMAAGLPVLYVGAGEGADLVTRHGAGWVSPPGDYPALAANLERLRQQTPAWLAQLAQRNYALAAQEFDQAQFLQSLLARLAHLG